MVRLAGRVAMITGGASGIGRATAIRFAAEGAAVAIGDIHLDHALGVVAEIEQAGGRGLAMRTDVTQLEDCEALVAEALHTFGRLDIVFCNAGVLLPGSVTEVALADWHRTLAVNLTGAFYAARAAIPALLESGAGSIVLMSSVSGLVGEQGIAAYCASKGGIVMLAKQMALDYARAGIRVNAICPGWIDTPFNDPVIERAGGLDALRPWIDSMVPMGRQGTPDEVADAVLFLASDDARLVTGHALVVDAGLTAQ